MLKSWIDRIVATLLILPVAAFGALAQEARPGEGQYAPWQLGMQGAVTPIAADIEWFHNILMWIITLITVFVLGLLIWVMVKFNEKANPKPDRVTHNALVEVLWTVLPVVILVGIAIPSFRLLRDQEFAPPIDMTFKVIGNQWNWGVEYPDDNAKFQFSQYMVQDKDLKPGQPRLLAVDNEIVVPVDKTIRVLVTATDVIHSYSIPAFGIRRDAVPGRLNETWFRATKEGLYYGQCSRLCGKDHAFMPSAVRVVSSAKYAEWLLDAKKKYAAIESPPQVAGVRPVQQ